jgi:hypothetical protein
MTEWQPIETAPKDGTRLLVWANNLWREPAIAYWSRSGPLNPPCWVGGHCHVGHIDQPTHWMPLPTPPAA